MNTVVVKALSFAMSGLLFSTTVVVAGSIMVGGMAIVVKLVNAYGIIGVLSIPIILFVAMFLLGMTFGVTDQLYVYFNEVRRELTLR